MLSALTLLSLTAHARVASADDAAILAKLQAQNWKDYPQWLRDNFTIANVRKFHTPMFLDITTEDGTVTHRVKLNNKVKELPTAEIPANRSVATVDKANVDPATIWQIGKALWQLIEDNKPTVNYTTDWAGAVPENVSNWEDLAGWQSFASPGYKFEFKNFVNMRLSELDWVFSCQYGATYQGKGKYLTLCGASVANVYAYLSEHVTAQVKGSHPFNAGTPEDPVAGLNVQVIMNSKGNFESTTVSCMVTVKGDGTYTVVQCDQN